MQNKLTSVCFFKKTCLKLAVVSAVVLTPAIGLSTKFLFDTPVPEPIRKQVVQMYDQASEYMKLCCPVYAPVPRTERGLSIRFALPDNQPKEIEAYCDGEILLRIRASSMRCTSIANGFLRSKYKFHTASQSRPS